MYQLITILMLLNNLNLHILYKITIVNKVISESGA